MKNLSITLFFLAFLGVLAFVLMGRNIPLMSVEEAESIAIEAYIYAYPLITMEMTREVMTNVATPEGMKAPIGQFAHAKTYPNADFKDVTAPNADTLYSTAWLDLSDEPYVLNIPNEEKRYFLMPMLSGWTNVFQSPGTRTTGTQTQAYAITGPGWKGKLPAGLKEIKSPTNMVWVLGRTYCTGTPQDYEAVHKIQDQYTLTPLGAYGQGFTPAKGYLNPNIDMKTPVRDQVNQMDVESYFNKLALLMTSNPPALGDAPMVAKMAKIGIVPGKEFNFFNKEQKIEAAIRRSREKGQAKILAHEKEAGKNENGWLVTMKAGDYGIDYLQRAYIAYVGLGANLPEDAVYPMTHVDSDGQSLVGANRYVIRFDKDKMPPVKGFWSLTLYTDQMFFSANPLNRFTLSPRDKLKANPDGSIDLYIQSASPGKEKESNWLPAPKDKFVLVLRLYWPEEAILKGSWKPPAVKKT